MKIPLLSSAIAVILLLPPLARAADPVVSNISAFQRAGTQLVDITYDVTADTSTVSVALAISNDSGATFSVPGTTVSGAVGNGVVPGTGKVITWNAGADWSKQYSTTMRFKVTADDLFVNIPAGEFQMGNALSTSGDGSPDELPVHVVNVSAFYMGKYEVTNELWDTVRAWGLNNGYTDLPMGNGSYISKGTNHPVHSISWYAVVKWCNARSEKEGLTPCYTMGDLTYKTAPDSGGVVCNFEVNGYRLPTEAEWEKAARGGLSGKRFPWGDTISHSQANYFSDRFSYSYDVNPTYGYHPTYGVNGLPYSSPVGSFSPNDYGLYDMAGNVGEWCWDWPSTYPSTPQTDPRGAATGTNRAVRFGAWHRMATGSRVAYRHSFYPFSSGYSTGFRLARSLVP